MMPPILLAIALLCVLLCPIAGDAKGIDYAVQVAALRSQQSALDLAKGLRSQGINAYWIGKNNPSQGPLYRVRIGKFSSIESAYLYAEELMDSGVFASYAITAYEPPVPATMMVLVKEDEKMDRLQAFLGSGDDFSTIAATVTPSAPTRTTLVPGTGTPAPIPAVTVLTPVNKPASGILLNSATIDMIASIGTRGWLLLSGDDAISATQKSPAVMSRELARLAAAVGSRRWSLSNDIGKIFAPPAPVNIADLAQNTIAAADRPMTTPIPSNDTISTPPVNRASATAISAPEIGRRPLGPTSPTPVFPGGRRVNYLAPPKLQGSLEMRNGQLFLSLRNLDAERIFTGSAKVTLSTDKDQQELVPMQLNLAPGKEENIPLPEARLLSGDWMMMVFDEGGVARLVRGASLATKPSPSPEESKTLKSGSPEGPPAFVTGMYDSTGGWKLAEQPLPSGQAPNGQPVDPNAGTPAWGAENPSPQPEQPPQQDAGPAQVNITPRQIAITPENVTMEFDISASRPLNYIVLSVRAGDYQDTRQALMTTPQGRVPFLIPGNQAKGAFFYELKDETGATLASGTGDFQQMQK
jgi:hypothetical protein